MSNILYKYLDINGAIMMLHYSDLMYANATTFNDPFDCHPSLIDCSNVPTEEYRGWTADLIEELHSSQFTNNREDLWICCLSKSYDSLLMWSYYNKHEGICIGLNMDHVAKYIDFRYGMIATQCGKDVQYRDVIDKPNYYRDREDFFNYQVYTKAKAWEHEQEVRLFIYKPSPMFMSLLPFQHGKNKFDHKEIRTFIKLGTECFESIYFGIKVDKEQKDKIIQLAKTLNPNIKIYQMNVDPQSFKVTAKQEMNYTLSDYIELFSNLHTHKQQGKNAPHKAIMLISVIELIASRHILSNQIAFTEELKNRFLKNWEQYAGNSIIFKPKAGIPYWHLNSEPFWQLIPYDGGYETIVKLQKHNPYSSKTTQRYIKYAVIDQALFQLLQEDSNRTILRQTLINSLDI